MAEIENLMKKYLKMQGSLGKIEKNAACPSEEILLDYMEQRLSGEELTFVEGHISGCRFCLSQLSLAQEVKTARRKYPSLPKKLVEKVKSFVRADKNSEIAKAGKKKKMKKNLFLVATIVFFILSFVVHRYFMQFLVGALILGFRWAFESESGRTLIMVLDSWRKHSHDDDDDISKRLKDRFSKHDL
ncbi:MAG: hypothetical protein WC330_01070 [Candidatus Omnitrophota bacterium]|jgi:hypothetical protein